MITRRQLREIHGGGIPMHILELDYVESVVLQGIYRDTDALVFKGGTCLRKAHGLNRFSQDLDFSLTTEGISVEQVRKAVEDGASALERAGMAGSVKDWRVSETSILCRLYYEGPLFTGEPMTRRGIEMDVARLPAVLPPEWRTIITEYPDTGSFSISGMDLREILLEKLRSLVQRRKPRDLYDLWYLFKKGVGVEKELVVQKFGEVGLEAPKDAVEVVRRYEVDERMWERDLGVLMRYLPGLKSVKGEVQDLV